LLFADGCQIQPVLVLRQGRFKLLFIGDQVFHLHPVRFQLALDLGHRGLLNGLGTATGIGGALLGGGLIARRGLSQTLIPILYLQNLAIPIYIALAIDRPPFSIVLPMYLVEQLVAGVGAAAQTVFLMQRVRGGFSASHYAFATAVVSLGSTLSGYVSGPLDQHFGHPIFFTIAFVASWPALLLVWFVPRTPVEASGHDGASAA